MARNTTIKFELDKRSLNGLKQLPKEIEKAIDEGMADGTSMLASNMRALFSARGHTWTGKTVEGIKAEKESMGNHNIQVPLSGVYLDSMRPHWINVLPGRKIRDWVQTKQGVFDNLGGIPRALYVKPHPWINDSLQDAESIMTDSIKSKLNNLK